MGKLELFAYFIRDIILLLASSIVVSSTIFASFLEVYLSHLVAGVSKSEIVTFLEKEPLLVFYYFILACFIGLSAVLVIYFLFRFLWELAVMRVGPSVEKTKGSACCCVQGLRITLLTAFFILLALFACFWIFWGSVLKSTYLRIAYFLELLNIAGQEQEGDTLPPQIQEASDRMLLLLVFFLVAVSLNILIVMRMMFNKIVLLGTNMKGEANRVSLFRIMPVNLLMVGQGSAVFRQLWVNFLFDVVELVTLAVWLMYPLYMVVFWVIEKECSISGDITPNLAVSPLLACAIQAKIPLLAIGIAVGVLLAVLVFLYLLRFIEERRRLLRKNVIRLTSFWVFGPVLGILFLLSCGGAVVSLLMMVLPLMSSLPNEQHINLHLVAVVQFAGCVFVLLYLGKKLSYSIAVHYCNEISFFLESACSLSGKNFNNLENPEDEEVPDGYVPLVGENTILF